MDMADRPAKRRRLFPSSENSVAPATCCSSTESTQSSDLTKEITGIADLEDETSTCSTNSRDMNRSTRREMTEDSSKMSSVVRSPPAGKSAPADMPSEAELEEFFAAAEKQIHKKFKEKYNFDVTKDQPLEGRYEWVKIKP